MLLPKFPRRKWPYHPLFRLRFPPRHIILLSLLIWLSFLYYDQKHPFTPKPHQITPQDIDFEHTQRPSEPHNDAFLPLPFATQLCAAQNWNPYQSRDRPRKIYDLIMLNNELDWLEIRLSTMATHVSYFIIMESSVTFTGLPKPPILKEGENWARFEKWHSQIIHRVVENMPVGTAKRTWDLEDWERNAMFLQGVLGIQEEEKKALEGDVLVVADVDEIVRPAALLVLRECEIPLRVTLRSQFYYYGLMWRHVGEEWAHPQATVYKGAKGTILPADLRNGEGGNALRAWWEKQDLWNAGWHCSSCFERIEEVLGKMSSFSHTGLNEERFRGRTRIVDRVRKGLDLWDREGEVYERVEGNQDVPEILREEGNKERFGYMLERDGSNAGFVDYSADEDAGE